MRFRAGARSSPAEWWEECPRLIIRSGPVRHCWGDNHPPYSIEWPLESWWGNPVVLPRSAAVRGLVSSFTALRAQAYLANCIRGAVSLHHARCIRLLGWSPCPSVAEQGLRLVGSSRPHCSTSGRPLRSQGDGTNAAKAAAVRSPPRFPARVPMTPAFAKKIAFGFARFDPDSGSQSYMPAPRRGGGVPRGWWKKDGDKLIPRRTARCRHEIVIPLKRSVARHFFVCTYVKFCL